MPPEQARGEVNRLDTRADVFGLGAILCEILTGQPPFAGKDVNEVLRRAASGDQDELFARLQRCGADGGLVDLAQACLAAQPEARLRDGAEVAARMAEYRSGVADRLRRAELERAAAEVRAVEERRRRRVQLALAGTLLLLLTVGGATGWWVRQEQVAKQQQKAQQIAEQALLEAELTRAVQDELKQIDQARQEHKWDDAEKVLEHAEGRLGTGGSDDLRERLQTVRTELAAVRKNQQMVAKLEDASAHFKAADVDGYYDAEGSRKKFEAAFRWYGLTVLSGRPEEVAARIEASPLREELVIALDRWATVSAFIFTVVRKAEATALRNIADRADANRWRKQVRQAILRGDDALVRKLAQETKIADLHPASINFLADALIAAKAPELALAIRRKGQACYPADFWLNYDLAEMLYSAAPPQIAEAARYFIAAQALRPESATCVIFSEGACTPNAGTRSPKPRCARRSESIPPTPAPTRASATPCSPSASCPRPWTPIRRLFNSSPTTSWPTAISERLS